MFTQLSAGLRQLIFPDNCLLCRTFLNSNHTQQLCPACAALIEHNQPPFCATCSRHMEFFSEDSRCEECRRKTLAIDRMWGCCFYTDPFKDLISAFKYRGKTSLHKTFVPIMRTFIETYHVPINDFDIICPIPLHPVRLRERGFNQAQLLSEPLGNHYNLRHDPSLLSRTSATLSQATLNQKQRWTNMQGAFKINPNKSIADKSILLVDDLLTTAATANAAADALKQGHAAYVGCITLAITKHENVKT